MPTASLIETDNNTLSSYSLSYNNEGSLHIRNLSQEKNYKITSIEIEN